MRSDARAVGTRAPGPIEVGGPCGKWIDTGPGTSSEHGGRPRAAEEWAALAGATSTFASSSNSTPNTGRDGA
jgi:hypothetical protein